jgi:pyrroloquinoline quinone biosynthesis protein B
LAITADDSAWFLLNVSPDIRQQIIEFPELGPPFPSSPAPEPAVLPRRERAASIRGTNIAGCVLTDAELDHISGLLFLREGPPFSIACTALVRRWLNDHFPIGPILTKFANPGWTELPLNGSIPLRLPNGSASGLEVSAFDVGAHVPRYVSAEQEDAVGSVVGLSIVDRNTGGRLVYAPCVGMLSPALMQAEADAIFMDGTFWTDDEPSRFDIAKRTAREMGHIPVSGPEGSLEWLARQHARHRVYVHINNTNPMLNERREEYRKLSGLGVRVGTDGDEFDV